MVKLSDPRDSAVLGRIPFSTPLYAVAWIATCHADDMGLKLEQWEALCLSLGAWLLQKAGITPDGHEALLSYGLHVRSYGSVDEDWVLQIREYVEQHLDSGEGECDE